jgi:EpsI family protein
LAAAIPWWLVPLIRYWGIQTEYADRGLILIAATVIAWRQYTHLTPTKLCPLRYLPTGLLLVGALLLPVGVFLQAQVTPRPLLLWWLLTAWLILTIGTLLRLGGRPLLRHFAFPLFFLLFALPLPQRLQLPLQFGLQYCTTTLAGFVLDALGWTVQRQGFILHLPHCDLNIVEACSGVRSVTAMLAVAVFLAYLHHLPLRRGLVLLILTLPVIVLINAGRVIVSGILCESWGVASIQGWWHQSLGLFMVVIGFGLLYGLTRYLQPRSQQLVHPPTISPLPASLSQSLACNANSSSRIESVSTTFVTSIRGVRGTCISLAVSTFVTLLAFLLGWQQQAEIQAEAPLEQLPLHFADFTGQDMPIADSIRDMLTPDQILHRSYRDSLGHSWEVWIIFWSSPAMVKGYHHPDVCWPNRGFDCLNRHRIVLTLRAGQLTVTERLFSKGSQRYMIWYWTQEGQQVWTEADERRVQLLGDSHDWVLERLWYHHPPQVRGRLTVWVGTPLWGHLSLLEESSHQFLGQLAEHLYQLCPWAYPTSR